MFNGAIHKALIKDTRLNRIKNQFFEVETIVNGRKIKLMYDFTEQKAKELIDPQLLFAIVNEDVHRVEF